MSLLENLWCSFLGDHEPILSELIGDTIYGTRLTIYRVSREAWKIERKGRTQTFALIEGLLVSCQDRLAHGFSHSKNDQFNYFLGDYHIGKYPHLEMSGVNWKWSS